jgi:hypothetical protein
MAKGFCIFTEIFGILIVIARPPGSWQSHGFKQYFYDRRLPRGVYTELAEVLAMTFGKGINYVHHDR